MEFPKTEARSVPAVMPPFCVRTARVAVPKQRRHSSSSQALFFLGRPLLNDNLRIIAEAADGLEAVAA